MDPAARPKRLTIRDIADEAGVSRGTVSRVLNGGQWVSPAALAAVTAAIERTGYTANRTARSLATGRSGTIAFLLTEPQQLLFEDPNFSTLLRATAEALSESDSPLVLIMASTPAERRRTLAHLTGGHVDGVVLVSPHAGDPLVADLLRARVPLVACGRPLGQVQPVASVSADDVGGARAMTQHLVDTGRRRIAMVTGPMDTSGGQDRLRGFREALGERFDEALVVQGRYSRASGRAGAEQLLREHPDVDAIFAGSDLMAAGVLVALRAAGRRVPDDVAVAGFDDAALAAETDPPLTTVRQPLDVVSREVVRLLDQVIAGAEPVAVVVPTRVVVRASA